MSILITGGSGFIGKNLVEGLKNKYKIFVPTHKQLDLLDYKKVNIYIKKNKIKIVIHTAIKGGDDVFHTTMRMFTSILYSIDYLDKFIHLGSGAEYAKTRDLKKVKEKDFGKFIPEDGYGFAKYLCSKIAENNKKIITLRLFGIYGKYEDYRFKFIANSIVKNLLKQSIKIKQNVIFDYLYIDDFIKIVDYFIKNKTKYNFYNVTPTKSIRLNEIVNIINKVSNYKSKISIVNKGLNFQYTADNNRLIKETKNLKFTNYDDGISKLYNYYSNLFEKLDKSAIIKDEYFVKTKIKNAKKKK